MPVWILFLLGVIMANEWVVNHLPQAGFSVESPYVLIHDSTEIGTDMGKVDYHSYHCTLEEEGDATYVFLVQYYQHPSLKIYHDSADLRGDFFAATLEQAALSIGGQVMIEDNFTFKNKYPAKFWRIHYNAGASVMKTQAIIVDDHFYMIQVAVDAPHSLSSYIDRFFETFRLIQ